MQRVSVLSLSSPPHLDMQKALFFFFLNSFAAAQGLYYVITASVKSPQFSRKGWLWQILRFEGILEELAGVGLLSVFTGKAVFLV